MNRSHRIGWAGAVLALALALAGGARADVVVTPLVTDARLAAISAGLVSDGTNLYFASTQMDGPAPYGRIYSTPLSGGGLTQLYGYNGRYQTSAVSPWGIALVGSNLFWIDAQSGPVTDTQIFRAPKDGSGSVQAIYTGVYVGEPVVDGSGLASDGTKLYSADEVQGRIHSLTTSGTGITLLATRYGGYFDREHANYIAVANGTVYIADQGNPWYGDTPARIQSVSTTGGPVTTLYQPAGPGFTPQGIAANDTTVFFTQGKDIYEMPATGGPPELLVHDARFGSVNALTLVGDTLYATDNQKSTIWKVEMRPAAAVPEPASLTLLGLGVLGLAGLVRRR